MEQGSAHGPLVEKNSKCLLFLNLNSQKIQFIYLLSFPLFKNNIGVMNDFEYLHLVGYSFENESLEDRF